MRSMSKRLQIAVVGGAGGRRAGAAQRDAEAAAYEVGRALARAGATVVTGGRGGVMAAANRGARDAGGLTVGVLPGASAAESPPDEAVAVAVFTGTGQARNLAVVLSAAAVVAVGGGWGTLSEIALALKHGIPVVTLGSWRPEHPEGRDEPLLSAAATAAEAVERALAAALGR